MNYLNTWYSLPLFWNATTWYFESPIKHFSQASLISVEVWVSLRTWITAWTVEVRNQVIGVLQLGHCTSCMAWISSKDALVFPIRALPSASALLGVHENSPEPRQVRRG